MDKVTYNYYTQDLVIVILLTFPNRVKIASKPLLKCQSTSVEKILVMVLSSKDSMEMMLRCRVKRPVMLFLPPPGGPIPLTSSYKSYNHPTELCIIYKYIRKCTYKKIISFHY